MRRTPSVFVFIAFVALAGCAGGGTFDESALEPGNIGPNGETLIETNVRMHWETEDAGKPDNVRVFIAFSGNMEQRAFVGEFAGSPLNEPLAREW